MTNLSKSYCPLSEDFFYWPPEEIAQYNNWCEVGNSQYKRRLKKVHEEKNHKLGRVEAKISSTHSAF